MNALLKSTYFAFAGKTRAVVIKFENCATAYKQKCKFIPQGNTENKAPCQNIVKVVRTYILLTFIEAQKEVDCC